MPTNEERANRIYECLATIDAYAEGNEDQQTQIVDMLTDIRHFCRQQEIDLERALGISEIHYNGEK